MCHCMIKCTIMHFWTVKAQITSAQSYQNLHRLTESSNKLAWVILEQFITWSDCVVVNADLYLYHLQMPTWTYSHAPANIRVIWFECLIFRFKAIFNSLSSMSRRPVHLLCVTRFAVPLYYTTPFSNIPFTIFPHTADDFEDICYANMLNLFINAS